MYWKKWIRPFHRWTSIVFTAAVIANFLAMTRGQPPMWITYSPLPPLFLLLFSGLAMFVLHYTDASRKLGASCIGAPSEKNIDREKQNSELGFYR